MLVILMGLSTAFVASAAQVTEVGRYQTMINEPTSEQINPLKTIQHVKFTPQIKTVGDAITYWIQASGYQLQDEKKLSVEIKNVLQKPLPVVDRDFGPMKVSEGLLVLVGKEVFDLKQDPLNRKVSFQLKPKYKAIYKKG